MRDFTTDMLHLLLSSLKSAGYGFTTVRDYIGNPVAPAVILRHDVDARPENSLRCAEMENRLGISGTYYFRTVAGAWDEEVIRNIHQLGHETGYHYEDLATAGGDYTKAIAAFAENLAKLRRLAPVETICMHGSPLSKYDNRLLWEKYSYRDYGIVGEPYLDIDFQTVHYLTDTGRRWNGGRYSIRDKVSSGRRPDQGEVLAGRRPDQDEVLAGRRPDQDEVLAGRKPGQGEVLAGRRPDKGETLTGSPAIEERNHDFRSTPDILGAAVSGNLPPVMMITIHPQRWDNRLIPWLHELLWQNTKNAVKRFLTAS